tara:strand:+ start:802 stop:1269 length:468 start_codon:yes stop_codon:yes gene_type:complete
MKNLKFLLILMFMFGCGYNPIYQTNQKNNFKINTIKYSGNKKINQSIISKIEKFKKNDAKNIFDLDLESFKKENIISKDKKGNASSYKLVLEVNLILTNKKSGKIFTKKFIKESPFNSMDNKFELNQYKNNIEKNMISKIVQDMDIFFNTIQNDL